MTGELEREYRDALRWYPRRWRRQHEDALLSVLLDQADAEGRIRVSAADRRNLARLGLAQRLAPVLLAALLVLGALAALQIGSMLIYREGFDTRLNFSPPPLHPVPIGTSWTPLFTLSFTAGTAYLSCSAIVVGAAAGAALLIRRIRRS